jgi:hypothetical protein
MSVSSDGRAIGEAVAIAQALKCSIRFRLKVEGVDSSKRRGMR